MIVSCRLGVTPLRKPARPVNTMINHAFVSVVHGQITANMAAVVFPSEHMPAPVFSSAFTAINHYLPASSRHSSKETPKDCQRSNTAQYRDMRGNAR